MNIKSSLFNFSLFIMISVSVSGSLTAQSGQKNWHLRSYEATEYNGINWDELKSVMDNFPTQPKTIIVAVLDSGVEVDHDDLDDVLWTNPGEIPGNGIDDDQNGYIDDIHGWNFIGGKDGSNVAKDTYESARLVAMYRQKFAGVTDPSSFSKKEKALYEEFQTLEESVEKSRKSAEKQLEAMESQVSLIDDLVSEVEEVLGDLPINEMTIAAIDSAEDSETTRIKRTLGGILEQTGQDFESAEDLGNFMKKDMQGALNYYRGKAKYGNNPDFDPRHIVGDNFSDPYEKGYGNNDYEGPDADHGTHVAGIIASEIDDKGATGISPYAQIMTVRVVPDGDERDKDVANGIIYAVDNGAKIINMSFGKGHSPRKEVVDKAVRYAEKKGVLLVHAAGNSSQDNDVSGNFPKAEFEKGGIFKRKSSRTWLEVGALAPSKGKDMVASFSNYGNESVDIFAPGVRIYSTITDNDYASFSGTSMASPVVAGAAAFIWSHYPDLTAREVRKAIIDGGKKINEQVSSPDDEKGTVPFGSLSKTGKILDLNKSFILAAQMSR